MTDRPEMKYLPRQCPFVKKEVWAILTKQADGSWRIVNCLDKDKACFEQECAFTTDGGTWPFAHVSDTQSPKSV
ncbi:MAG TPA: hypothetical protein DDX89_00505 [Candidatus Omnitrophica bacterium]|nr:MAG: hypothetical protein A2Z92_05860 [Omnitrophica WOR_2 bacterium GWA2_63_20]OGX18451.1 MAG: hypothetical protein A2105_05560 [Omnitrophica WOR_2 bacterium GWF2_63_9]OGX31682.1 MAG: hypothetical protein A3E56_00925 [Omnitrophica WOR_2 bacterium RIFCSPHIGHO2_12_FULL_64_13]OGX35758.1 MAG: hypothetical protein A3B73_03480 [Omnitrophica WOR_2 bacterium RIFCSPHIGHO2_02_FULL_63_39]OGX45750.1 MAG: hypothetical protein A3I71_01100 [Omnitrophica WOR_2 bacterium RIFCSPLOWO2_02_FULL_63_16]HAM39821.1